MGGGERREVTGELSYFTTLAGFALEVFAHAAALRVDAEAAIQEHAQDGVGA